MTGHATTTRVQQLAELMAGATIDRVDFATNPPPDSNWIYEAKVWLAGGARIEFLGFSAQGQGELVVTVYDESGEELVPE